MRKGLLVIFPQTTVPFYGRHQANPRYRVDATFTLPVANGLVEMTLTSFSTEGTFRRVNHVNGLIKSSMTQRNRNFLQKTNVQVIKIY